MQVLQKMNMRASEQEEFSYRIAQVLVHLPESNPSVMPPMYLSFLLFLTLTRSTFAVTRSSKTKWFITPLAGQKVRQVMGCIQFGGSQVMQACSLKPLPGDCGVCTKPFYSGQQSAHLFLFMTQKKDQSNKHLANKQYLQL